MALVVVQSYPLVLFEQNSSLRAGYYLERFFEAVASNNLPDVHDLLPHVNINAEHNGTTALWLSVQRQHDQVAIELLEHGADPYAGTDQGFLSTICRAAQNNLPRVVKYLLTRGADVDGHDGNPPLVYAAQNGHLDCVSVLLAHGADAYAQSEPCNGFNAFHAAAVGGHLHVLTELARWVTYYDTYDADANTPLHLASSAGLPQMAVELTALGASVNAQNSYGYTPLHLACRRHGNLIPVLLELGANPYLEDAAGLSAHEMVPTWWEYSLMPSTGTWRPARHQVSTPLAFRREVRALLSMRLSDMMGNPMYNTLWNELPPEIFFEFLNALLGVHFTKHY